MDENKVWFLVLTKQLRHGPNTDPLKVKMEGHYLEVTWHGEHVRGGRLYYEVTDTPRDVFLDAALIDGGAFVVFDQVARTPPSGAERERKYQSRGGPPVVRGRACTTQLVFMPDAIIEQCTGFADEQMRVLKARERALEMGWPVSEGGEGGERGWGDDGSDDADAMSE